MLSPSPMPALLSVHSNFQQETTECRISRAHCRFWKGPSAWSMGRVPSTRAVCRGAGGHTDGIDVMVLMLTLVSLLRKTRHPVHPTPVGLVLCHRRPRLPRAVCPTSPSPAGRSSAARRGSSTWDASRASTPPLSPARSPQTWCTRVRAMVSHRTRSKGTVSLLLVLRRLVDIKHLSSAQLTSLPQHLCRTCTQRWWPGRRSSVLWACRRGTTCRAAGTTAERALQPSCCTRGRSRGRALRGTKESRGSQEG